MTIQFSKILQILVCILKSLTTLTMFFMITRAVMQMFYDFVKSCILKGFVK